MDYIILCNRLKEIVENYKDGPIGGWITGDGPIPSKILFVGEAPGKNEIEQGKAFVGVAGKTLDVYLNFIDLKRKDIRITNTCYFRPTEISESKTGRKTVKNRTPKSSEIELFREVLNDEISLVNPKIIVTLGNIPLKRLTNFKSIGECHGCLHFNEELNRYIFPMYHPSAFTYNRSDDFLKTYKNDWTKLKEALRTL